MTYEQKEVVLMPFPYTDLTGKKLRPALIISNDKLNRTDDRLCVLVTSKESEEGIRIHKKYQEDATLPLTSYVKPHRLFAIDKKIIKKSLCKVSDGFYEQILEEITSYIK